MEMLHPKEMLSIEKKQVKERPESQNNNIQNTLQT